MKNTKKKLFLEVQNLQARPKSLGFRKIDGLNIQEDLCLIKNLYFLIVLRD